MLLSTPFLLQPGLSLVFCILLSLLLSCFSTFPCSTICCSPLQSGFPVFAIFTCPRAPVIYQRVGLLGGAGRLHHVPGWGSRSDTPTHTVLLSVVIIIVSHSRPFPFYYAVEGKGLAHCHSFPFWPSRRVGW